MANKSSAIPPFENLDYPVHVNLTIVPDSARYKAIVQAEGNHKVVSIDLTREDLARLNDELQEALLRLALDTAETRQELPQAVDQVAPAAPAARDELKEKAAQLRVRPLDHLSHLAKIGWRAFREVFDHDGVLEYFQELFMGAPVCIQVVSQDFFLPWELLYPLGPNTTPSFDNFLGMRHQIGRIIPKSDSRALRAAIPVSGKPALGVLSYLSPAVAAVQRELDYFDRLSGNGTIQLLKLDPLDPADRDAAWKKFEDFWKDELHVAHLACHAEFNHRFPDKSHFRLTKEFDVKLVEMKDQRLDLESHPLVVLNACETSNMSPLTTSFFAGAFLKHGARGVVATECKVPDAFAVEFVEQLYTHLLSGRPLGESLLAARRHFLDTGGNPSGLLYSMYAPPSLRLAVSKS